MKKSITLKPAFKRAIVEYFTTWCIDNSKNLNRYEPLYLQFMKNHEFNNLYMVIYNSIFLSNKLLKQYLELPSDDVENSIYCSQIYNFISKLYKNNLL